MWLGKGDNRKQGAKEIDGSSFVFKLERTENERGKKPLIVSDCIYPTGNCTTYPRGLLDLAKEKLLAVTTLLGFCLERSVSLRLSAMFLTFCEICFLLSTACASLWCSE